MKRVVKFRLYPSKRQKHEIFRLLGIHCNLYNYCREERITTYEKTKSSPSWVDQMKTSVPKFKGSINVSSLQQTVRRLDKAFKNFFRRVKSGQKPGFPRFKKRLDSMDFTAGDGIKVKGNQLYIQHVGDVKMVVHRSLPDYSSATIKYQNGQFYVSFVVEVPIKALEPSEKTVGLDFGLKTFITTSDGQKFESPKFLKQSLGKLQKLSRQRSKSTKGTPKYRQKSYQLRNLYRKITNQRQDFNHKLANRFIKDYGTIILEDLTMSELLSPISNINRTYNDVSWAQFTQMLSYKAVNAGRRVIKVNPRNTSKTCSECGEIDESLTLDKREFSCPSCGHCQSRDANAARNILTLGLQGLVNSA